MCHRRVAAHGAFSRQHRCRASNVQQSARRARHLHAPTSTPHTPTHCILVSLRRQLAFKNKSSRYTTNTHCIKICPTIMALQIFRSSFSSGSPERITVAAQIFSPCWMCTPVHSSIVVPVSERWCRGGGLRGLRRACHFKGTRAASEAQPGQTLRCDGVTVRLVQVGRVVVARVARVARVVWVVWVVWRGWCASHQSPRSAFGNV